MTKTQMERIMAVCSTKHPGIASSAASICRRIASPDASEADKVHFVTGILKAHSAEGQEALLKIAESCQVEVPPEPESADNTAGEPASAT